MNARWIGWVVAGALAGCGGGGTGGGTDSAGSSSGGMATGTTAGVTTGPTSGPGTGTSEATSGATQGAEESTAPMSTGPGPTSDASVTGSSGAETSTGGVDSSTGAGSTSSSTGAVDTGSSSTGVDTGSSSTGVDTDTEMAPVEGLWLIMIEDTSSPTRLYKIDLLDGHATLLCSLNTSDDYNTSTFGRDGTLYAANANTKNLESIDPCTCARTVIGPTNVVQLPGITADQGLGLYGLETSVDKLMTLNTMTGNATPVGALGIDWGTGGLTWSDDLKDTFAINGTDDRLYTIDHLTGKATFFVQTNYNFGSVGVEWHPKVHEIFACSNPAELLHVAQKDGDVTVVGPMLLENKLAHCDNLAAPWVPIACVENK